MIDTETCRLMIGGAGGFGRETIELVLALAKAGERIEVLGVLDDDTSCHGTVMHGVNILGSLEKIHDYPNAKLVVTIGNPGNYSQRREIVNRLAMADHRYAVLIHPTVSKGASVSIGAGTVIHAQAVLTADVRVGRHVVVMPSVVLTHDNVIDDFSTLASGAMLAGGVHINAGAYIGAGSLIREGIQIGEGSMIGMGSVVTKNVPAGEVWFGSPARRSH